MVRTNSGDHASSRSYQDVVTIANLDGGRLSDPSGLFGPEAVWAWAVCGRRAGLIRVEQAWAVPELVK